MDNLFKWKQSIAIRLNPDEVETINEQTNEMFPELEDSTTTRKAFTELVARAMVTTAKIRSQRNPADVTRIQELEADNLAKQNEIGLVKIDLDFKNEQIQETGKELSLAKEQIKELQEQSGKEIETIKSFLPGSDQVVISLTPFQLAMLTMAEKKLSARYKKPVTPEMILKELLFSYCKEESELNIPYVIGSRERAEAKKLHPEG